LKLPFSASSGNGTSTPASPSGSGYSNPSELQHLHLGGLANALEALCPDNAEEIYRFNLKPACGIRSWFAELSSQGSEPKLLQLPPDDLGTAFNLFWWVDKGVIAQNAYTKATAASTITTDAHTIAISLENSYLPSFKMTSKVG